MRLTVQLSLAAFCFQACECLWIPFVSNYVQFTTGAPAIEPQISTAHGDGEVDLLDLHRNLVTAESISGNEREVSLYLHEFLESHGLTVELQPIPNQEAYNVYAYLGSPEFRKTKVLLTSHIDTVPPFTEYFVNGSKIYGRGSCDAKGSVAAQIKAFLDMASKNQIQPGEVALLYVVGEEKTAIGMQTASKILSAEEVNHWDAVIFSEPTENKLAIGHKGVYSAIFQVFGKAAHSGYPELGLNSNEILIDILYKIQSAKYPRSDLLGPSTVNIGRIDAGVAANVISDHAHAEMTIRVAADLEIVRDIVETIVETSGQSKQIQMDAMGTAPQTLDHEVPGFDTIVLSYGTDIPHLHTLPQTKRYLYGPGSIMVAHAADEHIEVDSLYRAVDDFKTLLNYTLGR